MAIADFERNFIFIHIFKTAGNSVRKAMRMDPKELIGGHVDIRAVKNSLKRMDLETFFENAVKFTFVRNPFDWLVSTYHHMHRSGEGYRQAPVKEQDMSFSEGLRFIVLDLMQREQIAASNKYQTLYEFVMDENGENIMDFIGRVENLETDVKHLCDVIGIRYEGVPRLNVRGDRTELSYRNYYSSDDRKLVEKYFSRDLEFFEYAF